MIVWHAAPLLADEPRPGAVELDLRGRVRAVAELVLQPLDVEAVARRRPAARAGGGSRRARPAPARARGRRRTSAPSRTTCGRAASPRRRRAARASVVFARTSEPPWRSVIAMPQSALGLPVRREQPRVVRRARSAAAPTRRPGRARRAAPRTAACVIESGQPTPASTCASVTKSAARTTWAPGPGSRQGSAWTPRSTPSAHQPVPGGMELDLVDALAETVVRAQDRRVFVRSRAPRQRLAAELRAERDHPRLAPAAALAAQRLGQRAVLREEVVALERRRLVHGQPPARWTWPGSALPSTSSSHAATAISASRSTPVATPSPSSR